MTTSTPSNANAEPILPPVSLRDWFATHATEADIQAARHLVPMVTEVLNNFGPGPAFTEGRVEPKNWRQVARYLHADMMLKARQA